MKSWSQSSQKEKWKEKHNGSCPAKKGHLGDIQSQNRISDSQLSPELTFEKAKIKKKDIGHIIEEEMIIANSPFRKGILFWARDQVSHLIILATQGSYSIAWNQSNTCFNGTNIPRTYTELSVLPLVSPSAFDFPLLNLKTFLHMCVHSLAWI
jgi:hypothetical protein